MAWSISSGTYNPLNRARMKVPKPAVAPVGIGHHTVATRTLLGHAFARAPHRGAGPTRRRSMTARGPGGSATPGLGTPGIRGRVRKKRHHKVKGKRKHKHLVKGSLSARRHMASLRALRKSVA